MEFASVLAGEPFSDHPRCTHPMLAELARQVNDAIDDTGRQRLVCMVPDVVGVRGSAAASAVVILTATETALLFDTRHQRLLRAHERAGRRRDARAVAAAWVRLSDVGYRQGAAREIITACVQAVHTAGSDMLVELLRNGIRAVRDLDAIRAGATSVPSSGAPTIEGRP